MMTGMTMTMMAMTVMTMTMMAIAGGGIIVSVRRAEPTEVKACSPLTLLTIHQKYKDIIRYMKIKTKQYIEEKYLRRL